MSQVIATLISHPKHDIHKFQDIHLKLSKTNWVSWKQELLATARDRGLYAIITGADTLPSISRLNTTIVEGVEFLDRLVSHISTMHGMTETMLHIIISYYALLPNLYSYH